MPLVVEKKMSVKNECGQISWKMCEATSLTCPGMNNPVKPISETSTVASDLLMSGGTNKRQKKSLVECENQLDLSGPGSDVKTK